MNKPFVKELMWTNYLFIGGFALIFIVANLYYGGSYLFWLRVLPFLVILAAALGIKTKRIKARSQELDERLQFILYRSMSIGFFCVLSAVLWYFTKEMVVNDGQISIRTYVELIVGLTGYVGSYLIFKRVY